MAELTLEINGDMSESIRDLMLHYHVNAAQLVSKAIAVIKIAAYVERTGGELLVRKGSQETKLKVH
jgi:hypothetical protein